MDQEINFSTGRVITKLLFENEITAMDNDHTGQLIFAGDAQVSFYACKMQLSFCFKIHPNTWKKTI